MYTDVYVDVLFLINLAMDAIALLITSRLCSHRARPVRIIAAASIGAIYSVVSVFISFSTYFAIPVFLSVSVLMGCISFKPDSLGETVKVSMVLFISSALLGGVMSALYSMLNSMLGEMLGAQSEGALLSPALFFALGAVSFFAAMFLCRLHGSGNYPDTGEIEIKLWGKSAICIGIIDSGNLLSDPLSGRPVVVVRNSCVSMITGSYRMYGQPHIGKDTLGNMTDKERVRFRLIPAKGIGGTAYLYGFVPDELTLKYEYKGKTKLKETNALFAVVNDEDIDCECIIPRALI